MNTEQSTKLREPFAKEHIGKLPRKTKTGGTVQLDYVGHANVTSRLLSIDPEWSWRPYVNPEAGINGLEGNTLWIELTVCGVTRIGVGTLQGGANDPLKELISDAIRNAAMRFGVALDLWAKEELEGQDSTGKIDGDGGAPSNPADGAVEAPPRPKRSTRRTSPARPTSDDLDHRADDPASIPHQPLVGHDQPLASFEQRGRLRDRLNALSGEDRAVFSGQFGHPMNLPEAQYDQALACVAALEGP